MKGDIWFTRHAVERFIKRHAPGMSEAEAIAHLVAAQAIPLKERTLLGQQQFQIENPRCVLVMKRDHHSKRTGKRICVTVLPDRQNSFGWREDEQGIVNEWLADKAASEVKAQVTKANAAPYVPVKRQEPAPKPPPKVALPVDLEHARLVAEQNRVLVEASVARDRERTLRHEATERENRSRGRECLRVALTYLTARAAAGDDDAAEVMGAIQEMNAEFVSSEFLFVKLEGKRSKGAA